MNEGMERSGDCRIAKVRIKKRLLGISHYSNNLQGSLGRISLLGGNEWPMRRGTVS